MDLCNLDGLKDSVENLVKNVKEEDIEKIKDLLKDGIENADELKEKAEAIADKLPDMGEIKEQLGKLEGLKGLFGDKK